jgi:hypothetical protein
VSNFSSFWRPEKAIPAVSLNPAIQAAWLHFNHCSAFWLLEYVIEIQLSIMAT